MNIATLLLAAGASARLGQPKQLLLHHGQPLVRHMAQLALDLGAGPVAVVTGANAGAVGAALHGLQVRILHHTNWQTGMAGSLKLGVEQLAATCPDALLVLLTDQPHVSYALLQQLIAQAVSTKKGIIASEYGAVRGVPVLFRPAYFAALQTLTGDTGARKLIQQYPHDVATVPFPEGNIDLDTPDDLARWQRT